LIELLASWDIKPVAVLGHSSGEIAAAFCAGLITRLQALEVAFFKGVAVAAAKQINPCRGGMMAMRLSPEKCEAALSKFALPPGSDQDTLQIACYNSPHNTTLSGAMSEIDRLQPLLEADGIIAKKLNVGIAYHNADHLQTAANLLRSLIEESSFKTTERSNTSKPHCAFISSVDGRAYDENDAREISTSDHWVNNLVYPVQFKKAVQSLVSLLNENSNSHTYFLEIGPHSTLKSALKETLPKTWKVENSYSSILVREQPAMLTALTMAGNLHCRGYPINVAFVNSQSVMPKQHKVLTDLPPYPFDHSKGYWLESRISKNHRFRVFPHHDFLGTPTADWNALEAQWNNRIILQEKSFVKDHKVSKKASEWLNTSQASNLV
jgi:acyl transferase domain-containing protein